MGERSSISRLPPGVRDELDRRLIGSGFAGYRGLEDWLAEQGHAISKSALHRHGRRLEQRIEQIRIASEEARAIEKAVEDDGESISFGLLTQCQVELHQVAMAAESGDVKEACMRARALADLTRAGLSLRRERREGRREAAREAARLIDESEKKVADPRERLRWVRENIYGIVDA